MGKKIWNSLKNLRKVNSDEREKFDPSKIQQDIRSAEIFLAMV